MSRPIRLADWYASHDDEIAATLRDWVAIPSVIALSSLSAEVEAAAAFASRYMHRIGLRGATILDSVSAPAAYAEWTGAGDDAPTVLVLAHADVVPAAPLAEWPTPPFEPEVTDKDVTGRGAADGKGAALAAIESVHGLLESSSMPRVNLKFLIQGEATIGSPNLGRLLESDPERFAADIVVVPVAGAGHADQATVLAGTRGLVLVDVAVSTASHDAATANYGGAIGNPVIIASRLAADLVDDGGKVAIPGFYHRVRQLSDRGRQVLAALGFDETAWRQVPGARITTGEAGYTAFERLVARPSADVVAFTAGNRSDAAKVAVPAGASMRIAFGLVPDQRPDEIATALSSWIDARIPRGVDCEVSVRQSTRPTVGPVGQPEFAALVAATTRVYDTEPVLSRHGGVGPPDSIYDAVGDKPVLLVPVGDATCRVNAPAERLARDHLRMAVLTFAELWAELEHL